MAYCPLVDFHLFSLTKWFPITPSAIYICIDKTVPGFLDVTRFLSLDVTICDVYQLNTKEEPSLKVLFICRVNA